MFKRAVGRLVDASGRHPFAFLFAALLLMAATWVYASRIQVRSDLLELLPRDSPGFRAYEHQLGRVGGGASLIVVVESPNREANERFIDDLATRIRSGASEPIAYVESDTKDLRAFFSANRWLYADLSDLEEADRKLDLEIAEHAGLVEGLEESARESQSGGPPSMIVDYEKKWEGVTTRFDDSKGGYFETPDGKNAALRIVTMTNAVRRASSRVIFERATCAASSKAA